MWKGCGRGIGIIGCPTVTMEVAEELIFILEIKELGEVEEMTGNAERGKERTCPWTPTAVTGGDKGVWKLKAFRAPREREKKEDPGPESATRWRNAG